MPAFSPIWANALLLLVCFLPLMWAQPLARSAERRAWPQRASQTQFQIRQIRIHGAKDFIEIEVETSDRITPQPQMLAGPDRLVLDFPNAVPAPELRSQSIYVGAVKDIRAGLFRSRPPITRLVVDLDRPETYQIFPAGRTVMIKITTSAAGTGAAVDPWREPAVQTVTTSTSPSIQAIAPDPPKPSLDVEFSNGLLSISADKVTLAEVLRAVQQRTGAEISIAPGADQEKIVSNLGPAPAQEVLAHLLNGSKFNFLILNAAGDPKKLDRVILTPRTDGGPATLTPLQMVEQQPQPEPAMSQAEGEPHAEPHFSPPQPEIAAPQESEPPNDPQQ